MGRTGSQIAAALAPLNADDREAAILAAASARELPDFVLQRAWPTINRSIVVDGQTHNLFLYALPFLALGTDADPLWVPCRPTTGQAIADSLGAILLTPTLVLAIYKASASKVPLQVPPKMGILTGAAHDAYMQSFDAMATHSQMVNAKIATEIAAGRAAAPSEVAGHSKSVVIGPHLDGSKVAIYGGGGGAVDGWAIQSYPGPHEVGWVDYSQLVGFVFGQGYLDGALVDVRMIFQDPILAPLVAAADTTGPAPGPFDPRFPTTPAPHAASTTGGGGSMPAMPPLPTPPTVAQTPPTAQPPAAARAANAGAAVITTALGLAIAARILRP